MTDARKVELFDNAISYIWMHNEAEGKEAYVNALRIIGLTTEEIQEEISNCDSEEEEQK